MRGSRIYCYNADIKQLHFSEKGYLTDEDYYWDIRGNNYYTGIYYVEIPGAVKKD